MIRAIQEAYYLQARNPSDDDVLIDLAMDLGLDAGQFHRDLNMPETRKQLAGEIRLGQSMDVQGFPSLILKGKKEFRPIQIDYNDTEVILRQIHG